MLWLNTTTPYMCYEVLMLTILLHLMFLTPLVLDQDMVELW